MRTLLLTILLAALGTVAAATLVVHPFDAQDPALGSVMADRVAQALGPGVVGPAATPALVVPLAAPSGFVNPVVFIDEPTLAGRNGAWLLRGTSGADAALVGTVRAEGDDLVLRLTLEHQGAERRGTLRGDRADPGELAARAAVLIGRWLGRAVGAAPELDMAGIDGALGRALALVAAGLPIEALGALEQARDEAPLPARVEQLVALLEDAIAGAPFDLEDADLDELATRAVVMLNVGELQQAAALFTALADAGLPVGDVWAGTIAYSEVDHAAADIAFERAVARPGYDVALAARAAFRYAVGQDEAAAGDLQRVLASPAPGASALLLAALAANLADDPTAEGALLARLGRAAPFLAYAFERGSFLAFEADDPLGAAQALAVAIELDDASDLYWTNYGWALYLLGFASRSEAASLRALELDPGQFIARYNLGLVQVVTDRLDAALASYREALRADPHVDPEAIADLVAARTRYPEAIGVPFALALLHEARGAREAAATAFEQYVELAAAQPEAPAADAARVREARERAVALRAPLPPITIAGDPGVRLGRRGPVLHSARPGDPLVVTFEVTTEGDALPRLLELHARIEDDAGSVIAAADGLVDVPQGAIGFVVQVVRVELPAQLPSGRYALAVTAGGDGLEAEAVRTLEVAGSADPLRRLVGRDVDLLALETEQTLVAPRDLAQREVLIARLLRELRAVADVAEEVLPVPDEGRFAGLTGAEVFEASSEDDVLDFLTFVLDEGAADTSFTFVDGYAEWVLQGTP
jgi:tetratricopeptide (TPR) repeat protein